MPSNSAKETTLAPHQQQQQQREQEKRDEEERVEEEKAAEKQAKEDDEKRKKIFGVRSNSTGSRSGFDVDQMRSRSPCRLQNVPPCLRLVSLGLPLDGMAA